MAHHRQYFEILGLDQPPADRKAVKRAYSKMLKVTRPEENPQGFMALRDAHDQALNILKWQAEDASYQSQQAQVGTPEPTEEPALEPETEPGLTYSDMMPAFEPEPVSETSYAIGPTPNFDAPVTHHEPSRPVLPPLIEDLNAILNDRQTYNDRDQWNSLFRKARQLDIDEYVDFEDMLLENVLRFYDYYGTETMYVEYPGRLPERINQSIAASLFKTMSWDRVNTQDPNKNMRVDWLARRMRVRHVTNSKSDPMPVPIPEGQSSNTGKVWMFLFGFFILAKVIQALAGS